MDCALLQLHPLPYLTTGACIPEPALGLDFQPLLRPAPLPDSGKALPDAAPSRSRAQVQPPLSGAGRRLSAPLPFLRSLPSEFPCRLLGGGRTSLRERRGWREESSGAPPGRCGILPRCKRALAASEAIGSAQSPHAGLQRRPPRIGAPAGIHRGAHQRVSAAGAARKPTDSGLVSLCS